MKNLRCQHCSYEIVKITEKNTIDYSYLNPKTNQTIIFCSLQCKEKNVFIRARRANIIGMVSR